MNEGAPSGTPSFVCARGGSWSYRLSTRRYAARGASGRWGPCVRGLRTRKRPPAGGYVVRITNVEDVAGREYLNVVYDICEGDYAGFYSDDFGRRNDWDAIGRRFTALVQETVQARRALSPDGS